MKTFDDLVQAFGSLTELGKACGYEDNHSARGSDMKRRGSIPVERWPSLIAEAERREIEGVTPRFLMNLHAPAESVAS